MSNDVKLSVEKTWVPVGTTAAICASIACMAFYLANLVSGLERKIELGNLEQSARIASIVDELTRRNLTRYTYEEAQEAWVSFELSNRDKDLKYPDIRAIKKAHTK